MNRSLTVDDLLDVVTPGQPALAPEGDAIVYVLTDVDAEADRNRTALWRVSSTGAEPERLTSGPADSAPAWSPDGRTVAFLRADAGPAQVWLLPATGGEPTPLTSPSAGAGAPVWSPDGTRIAFTARMDTLAGADDDAARDRRAHEPIVIDRLGYKADGTGLLRGLRTHLHVVDVATGDVRQVTRGDWHAGDPAWSPDGERLAFPAATTPEADLTGTAEVYVADLRPDVATWSCVGLRGGSAGPVTWSPDAVELIVVGREDTHAGHHRLLRLRLSDGAVSDLAPDLDRNLMPGGPGYPGGRPVATTRGTIVFCARDRGCTHVYEVSSAGGPARVVVGGADRVVSGLSVAPSGDTAAVIVADPTMYGDVVAVDLVAGAETPVTRYAPPEIDLLVPEERVFPVSDGTQVHGWLLRDPSAPTPAPLLVDVHGGPHNAWSPVPDAGHGYHQLLAARGWTVLLLNPRGSDGYGEAFFTAALGGWGVADEADFLESVDHLVAEGIADPDRLALAGYSYVGYLACWLTGRTDRFAAAVAGGVVADLTSMAGTSDVGHLLAASDTRALPFEDRAAVDRQSPYESVAKVTTPTLILHGLADERCPAGQAEQWFAALRARGVPAELVFYPDASHLFILTGRPSHRIDYSRRIVDWVGSHGRRYPTKETTMSSVALDREHWQARLAELADRYKVPGAALGIAVGEETLELAHGVVNVDTAVDVTADTLFQIGSITKVWTASVVLALADAGKLDLDEPVVTYLPELTLADPDLSAQVTMRHLLTHTSGIDGDFFEDTGRGDECLERYVAALATLPPNHPLGATWSYCNAGFVIAGRVIEKLTGQGWDAAMKDLLYTPLGLGHTVTLPEEALLYRAAVGHVHEGDEEPRRAPVWVLPRALGPAGVIASTVDDVLAFARMHLRGGISADGTRVLAEATVRAMQQEEVRLPDPYSIADSWGLGWFRLDWNGTRLIGHDGNTIGQSAYLRVLPDHDVAVTVLTNGGHTRDLYETLVREVIREVTGVEMSEPLAPAPDAVGDIAAHVGTYERTGARLDVWHDDDRGPRLRMTSTQDTPGMSEEPKEFDLVPVRHDLWAVLPPGAETWIPVTFYQLDDGSPYVHLGGRATPKVS